LVYTIALAAVVCSDLPFAVKALIGLCWGWVVIQPSSTNNRFDALSYADGRWQLWCRNRSREVCFRGEQRVLPGLMILQLQEVHSRRWRVLVLWPDSVDAETHRRLRVYLRHGLAS